MKNNNSILHSTSKLKAYGLILASLLIACTAMTYFPIFLFFGPLELFDFQLSDTNALIFDAGLCFLFFIQHSTMLRKSIKEKFYRFIKQSSYPAVYSILTGITLWLVFGLWQTTSIQFYQLKGVVWGIVPVLYIMSLFITMWTFMTLGFHDPFGIKILFMKIQSQEPPNFSLSMKGPYRWIRHPLYLASLLIIWAASTLTADRLLFELLWTGWMIIGIFLEEKDLRNEFGDIYAAYQRSVPVIIPYKIPRP